MPTIVIAPDSFKGSLDAATAAHAIGEGIRRARPDVLVIEAPMADGGEGTLDIILAAENGLRRRIQATGPLGEPVDVPVGLIRHASTAVIEAATVVGYSLIPAEKRDPLKTTSFGLGQVIRAAIEMGLEEILLTLGGSATVDGGAGMMQALGLSLIESNGHALPLHAGGGDMERIEKVIWKEPLENLENVQFTIACDVLNPACGPNGAAVVFGPQKGADDDGVKQLDRGLEKWATLLEYLSGQRLRDEPGAGAAGGMALPLLALANAQLVPGVDRVAEAIGLASRMVGADWVVTGEGRLDRQSMMGKVVGAVGRMARSAGVPCAAIVGTTGEGVEACHGVIQRILTLEGPLEETRARLHERGAQFAEFIP